MPLEAALVQFVLQEAIAKTEPLRHRDELSAPRAEERTVEVALNLACNSAFITTGDGRGRTTTVSHFDPSWAQVVSIVRRALPQDSELAELRESPSTFPTTLDQQSP